MKKMLVFVLALCVVMQGTMLSGMNVFADTPDYTNGDLTYSINPDTDGSAKTAAVTGYKDRAAAMAASHTVTIPRMVTLDENGVYDPQGTAYTITGIGAEAFGHLTSADRNITLTKVSIPDSVTAIGDAAFGYCGQITGLTTVSIVSENGETDDNRILPPHLTTLGTKAFKSCEILESNEVVIPGSLKVVPDEAFYSDFRISKIKIEEGVERLQNQSFFYVGYNNTTPWTLEIPSTVNYMNVSNFGRMKSVSKVVFNSEEIEFSGNATTNGVNSWGTDSGGGFFGGLNMNGGFVTFYSEYINVLQALQRKLAGNFTATKAATFLNENFVLGTPEDAEQEEIEVTTAEGFKFKTKLRVAYNSNDSSKVEFNGILLGRVDDDTAETYAYDDSNGLHFTLEGNEHTIKASAVADNAFALVDETTYSDNTKLTGFHASGALTSIGSYAFAKCKGLTANIGMGNYLQSIGERAFWECSNIPEITLEDSVSSIGARAFESMSHLKNIHFGTGVTSIPATCVKNSYMPFLIIPAGVTKISGTFCEGAKKLRYVIYEGNALPSGWKPGASQIGEQLKEDSYVYVKQEALEKWNTANSESLANNDLLAEGKNGNKVYLKVLGNTPIVDYLSAADYYREAFIYNPTSAHINATYLLADYGTNLLDSQLNEIYLAEVTVPAAADVQNAKKEVIGSKGGLYLKDVGIAPAAGSGSTHTNIRSFLWDSASLAPLVESVPRKPW